MRLRLSLTLTLLALLALPGPAAAADIVEVSALKDNTLYEDPEGMLSNGAGDHFFAGRNSQGLIRRGLLAFDIAAAIPAGSTINSVTLRLHMTNTQQGSRIVELHRLLADWGEGTSHAAGAEGGGAPATPGDATWLHTFFDTDFWTKPGGDFSDIVSASQLIGDIGFYEWTSDGLVADVQDMLDNPAFNFGWLLLGDESGVSTGKRFDSRTNPTVEFRPVLTVDFTPIPAPGALAILIAAGPFIFSRRPRNREY